MSDGRDSLIRHDGGFMADTSTMVVTAPQTSADQATLKDILKQTAEVINQQFSQVTATPGFGGRHYTISVVNKTPTGKNDDPALTRVFAYATIEIQDRVTELTPICYPDKALTPSE